MLAGGCGEGHIQYSHNYRIITPDTEYNGGGHIVTRSIFVDTIATTFAQCDGRDGGGTPTPVATCLPCIMKWIYYLVKRYLLLLYVLKLARFVYFYQVVNLFVGVKSADILVVFTLVRM